MTIMVTGATGRLGRLVVEQVGARVSPEELFALVRDPAAIDGVFEAGVAARTGDYTDTPGLVAAFEGIDVLMLISSTGPTETRAAHHANAIEAARRAGVSRVVYTSVTAADTSPLAVAAVHRDTERRVRESGLSFTFLRNGMYHENYTMGLPFAVQQGVLLTSAGDGRVASAARADLALAAAVVLTEPGHDGKRSPPAHSYTFTPTWRI